MTTVDIDELEKEARAAATWDGVTVSLDTDATLIAQAEALASASPDRYPDRPAEGPRASAACPVCGVGDPHGHTPERVEAWVNERIAAWHLEARVFARGARLEELHEARRRAWDEGYEEAASDFNRSMRHPASNCSINPYRVAAAEVAALRGEEEAMEEEAPGLIAGLDKLIAQLKTGRKR